MDKQQRANKSIHLDSVDAGSGEMDSAILDAVRGIRYGTVEIVIHDSKVVQIECKERIRFAPQPTRSAGRDK